MQKPLISVCVPIYNTSKYLEECLESLFNQTIADKCEFIFVNDCSTDNSMEILDKTIKKYKSLNIKIINHEINKGLAEARNSGILNACGEYIIHIDSDDYIELDYIELLYNDSIKNNSDLVVHCCPYAVTYTNNIDAINLLLNHKVPVVIWCKLAKRSIYTENNLSWKPGINVGEDLITSCKLFYFAKNIFFSTVTKYNYRMNIGFSTKMKKLLVVGQKVKEYDEIESFFHQQNIFSHFEQIINLRKAEIRYEYIKNSPILSLKKFNSVYPEIKLCILYQNIKEYNSLQKKIFINFIDKKFYTFANLILIIYNLLNKNF